MLRVFVPRDGAPGETRVAATPETVKKMAAAGLDVHVETGAGHLSSFSDDDYRSAGATVVDTPDLGAVGLLLAVGPPSAEHVEGLSPSALAIGLLAPHQNLELVRSLAARRVDALAMELVPRISRAQSMDALSSQASIAGYKAVLLAAYRLGKYFPLLMTAAGTIKPAKVVVMGAGVAGLQAVATAKRLGAIVEVSDIREVVKEQVESLGGRFIELPQAESGEGEGGYAREMGEDFLRRQREIVTRHVEQADAVICTALIPGKKAPVLVTREMVERMKPGALVVDLAVAQGGNCELSRVEEEVDHGGVRIFGPANLPAETPVDASQLYARNVWALIEPLIADGALRLDLEDEVVAGALLLHEGEVRHGPTRAALGLPIAESAPNPSPDAAGDGGPEGESADG
ncbi:MAG: Re/Si-specific NAD(P)(+) transhydrogenase subunit alpha [Acidobacteriota bacterium]